MDFIISYNNAYWYSNPQMIFPVVPSEGITIERAQNNIQFDGYNGQMQSLGTVNLASVTFESILPTKQYSFMRPGSTPDPWHYISNISACRSGRIPVRAVLLDNDGKTVFNIGASIDSFSYSLDRAGDYAFSLTLTEYRFANMPTTDFTTILNKGLVEAKKNTNIGSTTATSTSVSDAGTGTVMSRFTTNDATLMAKTMYGEARGLPTVEVACVGWCILNRVDDSRFPNTIAGVITQKSQFSGYKSNYPSSNYMSLATDVCNRWSREKAGQSDVGRVLPSGYCWFKGFSGHNWFRKDNKAQSSGAWDYSLPSPY